MKSKRRWFREPFFLKLDCIVESFEHILYPLDVMLSAVRFKKSKERVTTLTCIRSDGSATWSKLKPGMESHDLAHYVVEKELGFQNAFFGLLDRGFQISDFELPREHRPRELTPANLPHEALQTEHIVNLLQIEYFNSGEDPAFLATLAAALDRQELPFPKGLDETAVERIREKFRELIFTWRMLPPGETLELAF